MGVIREALYSTLADEHPMTVRQVFYQLVSRGTVEKTEAEYKGTVCRLLADMRRAGLIPYWWLADSTRWMRKPRTYSSLEDALLRTAECYRRSVWDGLDCYVEIWLEKDALAGVLYEVTSKWDVPLMVTRGYPSLSFLYSAAQELEAEGKPTHLYYFGDLDPSGVDITRAVEEGLREMAPNTDIVFERVAVTPAQVEAWGLPTRPTKKTDTRAKAFEGESVEVDAIPPRRLRALVENCIERHVPSGTLEHLRGVEDEERHALELFAQRCANA